MARLRAMETPEQRDARKEKDRLRHKQGESGKENGQRKARLDAVKRNMARLRGMETPEQCDARKEKDRLRHKQGESGRENGQRKARLDAVNRNMARLRAMQTPEQRDARKEKDRLHHKQGESGRENGQRKARLEAVKRNMAQLRAKKTPAQRQIKLQEDHMRIRSLNALITTFNNSINVFCDKICDICTKRCYSHQVSIVKFNRAALSYLPRELSTKTFLLLCSRCRTHITTGTKREAPSKAYWNNLNPGDIPEEIRILSQAEQRLLSRIIPFIKVVKFSGKFGQYGFRGHSVLFAQDIFEVSERLPNMLPRPSDQTGIIIVTEHLENLNIIREFSISRERVFNGLRWLIANNPLYKDVTIDENVEFNEQDVIRQVTIQQTPSTVESISEQGSAYIPINENARIVRASWHQGNNEIFTSSFAGVQSCAITVANIIRAAILRPSRWSTLTLDMNMIAGDKLYNTIRLMTPDNDFDTSGYLELKHFNNIKHNIIMFNGSFEIEYDENTDLFGSLHDSANKGNIGKTLHAALDELFTHHIAGILIAASKALGIMHYENKYYFTDSHSCGAKGAGAANGKACIIECDTIQELHRICKRSTSSRNIQYTINHLNVLQNPDTIRNLEDMPNDRGIQTLAPAQEQAQPEEHNSQIQTSVMVPIDCVYPDVEEELEVSENINKIRRKTKDNIVNEAHELKAEEFAWYYLFPYGINGLKEQRPVRITPLDYYQFRILGSDLRFQRNDYLFYALSMFEYYRVKTTISACGRSIQGQDGNKVEHLHLYMKNLRGSSEYWRTALNDLIAQIRCLGPPTYFITFSCNDLHWFDMRKALLIADGRPNEDPKDLDINESQRLLELYPVIVSRHFMVRVNALMKFLKNNNEVFCGRLMDYWWRIEFQNRGSPHLHMVTWIEGHARIETPEGIEQVNKVCSCEMPSQASELYELVKKCQVHRHTSTCQKNASTSTVCRFNMPRNVCAQTHIVDASTDEFLQNGGRICLLKRRNEDRWINNYNPILLGLWKANMDIQPCGSNESIAYYVAKYISKSEPTGLDAGIRESIRQIQREETDVSRKLFRICMRIMKERQVSACECVFRLCHLNLRESSRKAMFLNTRKPAQRYKKIKFDEAGQADGYFANMFERYEKRPTEHEEYNFNEMSLVEFAMRFEPYYAKVFDNEENVDEDVHKQERPARKDIIKLSNNLRMFARKIPAVIRVPHFVATTDPENYYYSLLLQYMPYRNETELMEGFNNAREAFLAREQILKESSAHMELYRERDRQLENAFNQVHAFQILEESEPLEMEETEDIPYQAIDENEFQMAQRAMNTGQREIFAMVTQSIQLQLNGAKERLKLFFTGGAGVGKTFLLNLLRNQINRCYTKESVKVCALTGVAARLINGSTIHTTLKLPVQKDGQTTGMPLLTGNYLRIMRQEWRDIEFIIIDEISMVSYQMLCMIDSRLKQLKNKDNEFFGGINILLFGDLLQLPPIKRSGNPVYKQPQHLQPATHLWKLFTLWELTQNMRQQGDNTFIEILNALRIGEMRPEHFSILTTKLLQEPTGEFTIEKALRIYPTNKQVEDHNNAVLQYFKNQNVTIYTIKAQDQIVDATRKLDNVDLSEIIPTDINKTGGLPKKLEIFVGAKVMLRSNIDQPNGLVNGAIGFITEIVWPLFRRKQMYETDIPSVCIDFGRNGIHQIKPKAIQFPAKFSYGTAERRMLPIVLSWASTVHKLQGSSVDNAVVYLGPKMFEEGQAYVALSRVRSLDGLRIEELDCAKLTGKKPCNSEALAEMERMRNNQPN